MKFPFISHRGFTIIEMMGVVTVLGILMTILYVGGQPYLKRGRDANRIKHIDGFVNAFDAYYKTFDVFPSNQGSGGVTGYWYCISEIATRPDYANPDQKFKFLFPVLPETDPNPAFVPISPCTILSSYSYYRMQYAPGDATKPNDQVALFAANLELKATGNYGTGADFMSGGLANSSLARYFYLNQKRGTIPDTAVDSIYFRAWRQN